MFDSHLEFFFRSYAFNVGIDKCADTGVSLLLTNLAFYHNAIMKLCLSQVMDATDDEPWGPHGTVLAEIAQCTKK